MQRMAEKAASTAALLLVLFAVSSCETSFEPFQKSDYHFSIFGYLDTSADTQFVRVTPLRDSLYGDAEPVDAVVTLTHLASGSEIVLKDSLFWFEGRPVHNFWSALAVAPGETYRLTVTRSDGAASAATVELPAAFPDPVVTRDDPFSPPFVKITGVERLADVKMQYLVRHPTGREAVFEKSYLSAVARTAEGFLVQIRLEDDLEEIYQATGGTGNVVAISTLVAAAGPDWPDLAKIDDETLALAITRNVEQGVGFLGGVVSKTVRW